MNRAWRLLFSVVAIGSFGCSPQGQSGVSETPTELPADELPADELPAETRTATPEPAREPAPVAEPEPSETDPTACPAPPVPVERVLAAITAELTEEIACSAPRVHCGEDPDGSACLVDVHPSDGLFFVHVQPQAAPNGLGKIEATLAADLSVMRISTRALSDRYDTRPTRWGVAGDVRCLGHEVRTSYGSNSPSRDVTGFGFSCWNEGDSDVNLVVTGARSVHRHREGDLEIQSSAPNVVPAHGQVDVSVQTSPIDYVRRDRTGIEILLTANGAPLRVVGVIHSFERIRRRR